LKPVAEVSGQYWKDLSGVGYDPAFSGDFSYDNATIVLSFDRTSAGRFSARLVAEGLKPDFCYQVKLEGKPWAFWVYASDDAANEALGYAGRFWRVQPEPGEASDLEYQARKDEEGHVYIGSFLLDFFVTDETGSATIDLSSTSSYRMVWKSSQRAPQPGDGPVREFQVAGQTVAIYGESLSGRVGPGLLELPPGFYNVQLSLTEESFGDPDGSWARVMVADEVSFEILEAD